MEEPPLTVEELKKLLAEREKTIENLEAAIYIMQTEKEDMVQNFKRSTDLLIERLKYEVQQKTGVRPQTAHLLAQNRASKMNESAFLEESTLSKQTVGEAGRKGPVKEAKCHNCNRMIEEVKLKKHLIECFRHILSDPGRSSSARLAQR